jgi:spermidine dehydrogenase
MTKKRGARRISRRDFLNGVAIGAAGLYGAASPARARGRRGAVEPEHYPPSLTGLRGSHAGSETIAHALRNGAPIESLGTPVDTGEVYDLIVVGGGVSGLSAAHFFQKSASGGARVLVLENHDDAGGHARRNEFRHQGQTWLGYGGAIAIDSPKPYSAVAHGLLKELGVDVLKRGKADLTDEAPLAWRSGIFFDRETFGQDKLLADPRAGEDKDAWAAFLSEAPLAGAAKVDLRALYAGPPDPMPGVPSDEKKRRLARISYARFLTETLKLHPQVVAVLQTATHDLYGVGIDAVPAQDAWGLGLPGFKRMQLAPGAGPGMNHDAMPGESSYYLQFPDGNATIARLLIRGLIPAAVPADGRLDYARLDRAEQRNRVRLESTVVRVRQVADAAPGRDVEVTYVQRGKLATVRAGACVLACWNGMIPYICPGLPAEQKEALAFGAKVPLLYTNVFLANWQAFKKLGVKSIAAPGSYHTHMSLGDTGLASQPAVLHLGKTPNKPGLPAREQHRMGRMELITTPFAAMEGAIRDQLTRTLAGGGFDAARDILAITVNRWSHGYAYQYNSLWDPFWLEGGEEPCVRARKPFGRIAIANADAGAYSYCDGAIDQAHRAVRELFG